MFFNTSDFSVDSLSVFRLEWNASVKNSGFRPYHALSFRIKGNAAFIHEEKRVTAKTGDIVFVPAFYPYTLDCEEGEKMIVAHFTASAPLADAIRTFSPDSPPYFEKLFEDLYHAYSKKQLGFEHECRALFHKIVMRMEQENESNQFKTVNHDILPGIKYILSHFRQAQLSIAEVAKRCNMSETYFRKLFKQNFGMTPLKYINELKRQYAIELLQSQYYSVSDVSEKCGFANPYYFCLFMKKMTGHPPSYFLKAEREI